MKFAPLTLAIGLMLAAAPASAQPDLARKEASARFDEGNQAYAAGRYEEARLKFNQAWVNFKRPNVLFNLARAEHLTGHLVDAARHYREYLRLVDPKISPTDRQGVDKYLADVREKVGRIAVVAPRGTVITIDGERIDDPDLAEPVEVGTGSHVVAGMWAGKTKQVDLAVAAGSVGNASFVFDEPAPASSSAAPVAAPLAASDRPSLTPPPAAPSDEKFWTTKHGIGIALAGLAVVGAGAGVFFAASREGHVSDENDIATANPRACQDPASAVCRDFKDARDGASSAGTAEVVSFVAAGALAVGAVVLLWPAGRATPRGSAQRTFLAPAGRGLFFATTF